MEGLSIGVLEYIASPDFYSKNSRIRWLLIHPPGLERFFEEIAQLPTPPSVEAVRSIFARYGMTPVG